MNQILMQKVRNMQKLNKLSVNFKNFDILLRKYIYTLLKMLVIKFQHTMIKKNYDNRIIIKPWGEEYNTFRNKKKLQ